MKVLLLKDVYKLGRAGDVKRVADGFGRNYLIPQGLAVLATEGARKQAENIRQQATVRRAQLNEEMSGVASLLKDITLTFPAKAGETGKLYGSVTPQNIADALSEKIKVEIDRRSVDVEPIRQLGVHQVNIRLTMDLAPEVTVIVHREGETPESQIKTEEAKTETAEAVEEEADFTEDVVEVEEVEDTEEETESVAVE